MAKTCIAPVVVEVGHCVSEWRTGRYGEQICDVVYTTYTSLGYCIKHCVLPPSSNASSSEVGISVPLSSMSNSEPPSVTFSRTTPSDILPISTSNYSNFTLSSYVPSQVPEITLSSSSSVSSFILPTSPSSPLLKFQHQCSIITKFSTISRLHYYY